MYLSGYIRESFANLLTSKVRSLLTLLGILVGTASVVALISSGELATQHALAQFKALGTNLLSVSIESGNQDQGGGQAKSLTLENIQQIQNNASSVLLSAPYTSNYSPISYNGVVLQGGIIGTTESLASIVKIDIARGRFVSYLDKNEHLAVLGSGMADSLGKENPIGQQVRVGNTFFTIIGVAKPWQENMFVYSDINNALIIPIAASFTLSKYVNIQNIVFQLKANTNIPQAKKQIITVMKSILPDAQLFFRSPEQIIEGVQKQRRTFTLMLGAIGGISLIVGGIGVMNIMLVSVIERRREIGVRMAIGARRRDIQYMFLTEAVILTLFGGIIGDILGVTISLLIGAFSQWGVHIFWFPPLIGFVVSAVVGIFFGFYPALQASKLDPIETLRSE